MRFPLAAALLFASGTAEAADCSRPLLIAFPAGATTVTLDSGPPADAVGCYQLNASAGQKLTATIQTDDHAAFLDALRARLAGQLQRYRRVRGKRRSAE